MSFGTRNWDEAVLEAYRQWESLDLPDDPEAASILQAFVTHFRAGLSGDNGDVVAITFPGFDIDLRGAVLDGAPWSGAWLNGATLDGVRMRKANLSSAQLQGASLRQADLGAAKLNQAEFDHANAREVRLEGSDLAEISAFETDFRDAVFRDTDLTLASFTLADLRGADLRGARADTRVWLKNARVAGAALEGFVATSLVGPVFVTQDEEQAPLGGHQLQQWFTEQGAHVMVEQTQSA